MVKLSLFSIFVSKGLLSAVAAVVPVMSFTDPVLIATSLYGTFALVSVFVFVLSEEPLEELLLPLSELSPEVLPLSDEPLFPLSEESPPEDESATNV